MSVIENIQKLFKTKSVQPEDSMDMASVGTPDPLATGAMDEASLQTASAAGGWQ
jgi:twitching motility protein PilJ